MVWAADAASVTPRKCSGMEMNLWQIQNRDGSTTVVGACTSWQWSFSLAQFSVVLSSDLLQWRSELQMLVPAQEENNISL